MKEITETDQINKPDYRLPKGLRNSILSLIIWAAFSNAATASSVRTINLPEMTDSAGMVFYGKCLAVETSSSSGILAKRYSFQVIEALKGVEPSQVVSFQQIDSSGSFRIPGVPVYQKGQELLLFLYPDSRLGLTSPVGLGQGLFQPRQLPDGQVGFSNAYGNRNLSARLEQSAASELGLSEPQWSQLRSGNLISLAAMKEMVNQFSHFKTDDQGAK